MTASAPAQRQPIPPRPGALEERVLIHALYRFGPGRPRGRAMPPPPAHLAPFEHVRIPRNGRGGHLAATWYLAPGPARGAVLLGPPYLEWGRSYFHRRGRIEALRQAGYHALAFDVSGLGESDPPTGLWDRDVDDAIDFLRARAPDLPVHAWGVSNGGYWMIVALARRDDVHGAMFEDVTPHLMEYAAHRTPARRLLEAPARALVGRGLRYIDLRAHAPHLRVRAAAFAYGDQDAGIPSADARALALAARARLLLVEGARHLDSIKRANADVIRVALETFAAAERASGTPPAPPA